MIKALLSILKKYDIIFIIYEEGVILNDFISVAKPHTIKKFEIINNYVDAWARKILGYSKSEGLYYIDCMSNCGYYTSVDNESIEGTAVRVAKTLNRIAENYPSKTIDVFFNDYDSQKINYLQSKLSLLDLDRIKIHYSIRDCSEFLNSFDLRKIRNRNILLVYDPYQAIINWDSLSPFLNSWGEVIINHMVSDTARGAKQAKKESVIKKYEQTYKMSINDILALGDNRQKLDDVVKSIIKKEVENNPRKHHIASFPFFNRTNGLVYNLLFCSSNVEGIKLFKRTSWDAFGGRSSDKNTHGSEIQLTFDLLNSNLGITIATDNECYTVSDIAKYIVDEHKAQNEVLLEDVYKDLDVHSVFPSDGYKSEIKDELKTYHNVKIIRKNKKQYLVF